MLKYIKQPVMKKQHFILCIGRFSNQIPEEGFIYIGTITGSHIEHYRDEDMNAWTTRQFKLSFKAFHIEKLEYESKATLIQRYTNDIIYINTRLYRKLEKLIKSLIRDYNKKIKSEKFVIHELDMSGTVDTLYHKLWPLIEQRIPFWKRILQKIKSKLAA